MSKYLLTDPVNWLLDPSDPVMRYLTLRDLLKVRPSDLEEPFQRLIESHEIQNLLQDTRDGLLGDHKNYDTPSRGTLWLFAIAVLSGLDCRLPAIKKSAEFLLERTQLASGGFSPAWKPLREDACFTGDVLRYLLLAGCQNSAMETGIRWIESHQRQDGGWLHSPVFDFRDLAGYLMLRRSGRGLYREGDSGIPSCLFATSTCLSTLLLFQYRDKNDAQGYPDPGRGTSPILEKAAGFILRAGLFHNASHPPTARYKRLWNRDFSLLGLPVFSQYDTLLGLHLAAATGHFSDHQCTEAFNALLSKQSMQGTWYLETSERGMLTEKDPVIPASRGSKRVTLRVLIMMKEGGIYDPVNIGSNEGTGVSRQS